MMDVIVIKDIEGFTKGKSYRVISGNADTGVVFIQGDDKGNTGIGVSGMKLDVDCIVAHGPFSKPDMRDMLLSYSQNIDIVGGDPRRFVNEIKKMTVYEMMDILAPNGIRFTHEVSHVNRKELAEEEPGNLLARQNVAM